MRGALISLALIGCVDEGSTASASGTTVDGSILEASCAPQDNALRFDCRFTLAEPVPLTVEVDGRSFVSADAATDHVVTLWGLAPEATVGWTALAGAGSASGELTTGSLPAELDALTLAVDGDGSLVDAVLIPQSCGGTWYGLLVDGAGAVRWYEALGTAGGPQSGLTGFDWSDEGTLVAALDGSRVVEIAPSGEILWTSPELDRPLHHDVAVAGDHVWALNAGTHTVDGETWVVDGVTVLTRAGAVIAEWDLADQVPLVGTPRDAGAFWEGQFPGAGDWSHGNSVDVGDDGLALLSARWLDAVIEWVADPDDPDFGTVTRVIGADSSPLPLDVLADDFDGQHHGSWSSDGLLQLFDNGGAGAESRALRLELDGDVAWTAESYGVGEHCDIQGAAYELPGGGMLATCATAGRVEAFERGVEAPAWTLTASCDAAGGPPVLSRGVPVAL